MLEMNELEKMAFKIYAELVVNKEFIPEIIDEDVVLSDVGDYVQGLSGHYNFKDFNHMFGLDKTPKPKTYMVITTFRQRLVRSAFDMARDFLIYSVKYNK